MKNLLEVVRMTVSPEYAREVSAEYWRAQVVSLEELTDQDRERFFANLATVLAPRSDDEILDYGCGAGEKASYLTSKGYNVTGADISDSLLSVARTNGVDCCVVDELCTSGRTFDRIFMHGVFMYVHPRERTEFLTRVRDLLKPGGKLFLLGEPDIDKRNFGPRNSLQTRLAPVLPVYQFFNASFWTRQDRLRRIAIESGFDSFEWHDGPPTISAPDRSHFVLSLTADS